MSKFIHPIFLAVGLSCFDVLKYFKSTLNPNFVRGQDSLL